MGIRLIERNCGRTLDVLAGGKITHGDYRRFALDFVQLIKKHGRVRILFEMEDFQGWKAEALWTAGTMSVSGHDRLTAKQPDPTMQQVPRMLRFRKRRAGFWRMFSFRRNFRLVGPPSMEFIRLEWQFECG
jgi:hypothetical protein